MKKETTNNYKFKKGLTNIVKYFVLIFAFVFAGVMASQERVEGADFTVETLSSYNKHAKRGYNYKVTTNGTGEIELIAKTFNGGNTHVTHVYFVTYERFEKFDGFYERKYSDFDVKNDYKVDFKVYLTAQNSLKVVSGGITKTYDMVLGQHWVYFAGIWPGTWKDTPTQIVVTDGGAPTVSFSLGSAGVKYNDKAVVTTANPNVTIDVSDRFSSSFQYCLTYSSDESCDSKWTSTKPTVLSLPKEGLNTVNLRVKDASGNTTKKTLSLYYDKTRPYINGGITVPAVTSSKTVKISWQASDNETAVKEANISLDCGNGYVGSTSVLDKTSYQYVLDSTCANDLYDGMTLKVKISLKDYGGNTADVEKSFVYDARQTEVKVKYYRDDWEGYVFEELKDEYYLNKNAFNYSYGSYHLVSFYLYVTHATATVNVPTCKLEVLEGELYTELTNDSFSKSTYQNKEKYCYVEIQIKRNDTDEYNVKIKFSLENVGSNAEGATKNEELLLVIDTIKPDFKMTVSENVGGKTRYCSDAAGDYCINPTFTYSIYDKNMEYEKLEYLEGKVENNEFIGLYDTQKDFTFRVVVDGKKDKVFSGERLNVGKVKLIPGYYEALKINHGTVSLSWVDTESERQKIARNLAISNFDKLRTTCSDKELEFIEDAFYFDYSLGVVVGVNWSYSYTYTTILYSICTGPNDEVSENVSERQEGQILEDFVNEYTLQNEIIRYKSNNRCIFRRKTTNSDE